MSRIKTILTTSPGDLLQDALGALTIAALLVAFLYLPGLI